MGTDNIIFKIFFNNIMVKIVIKIELSVEEGWAWGGAGVGC